MSSKSSTAVDNSNKAASDQALMITGRGNKIGTTDIKLGTGASVTTTDFGAVQAGIGAATSTAESALNANSNLASAAFSFGNTATSKAADLSASSMQLVGKALDTLVTGKAQKADAGLALPTRVDWVAMAKWGGLALVALLVIAGLIWLAKKRKKG